MRPIGPSCSARARGADAGLERRAQEFAGCYKETKLALDSKEVRAGLAEQGISVIGNTPAQAAQFFRSELVKHANLLKRSGASLDWAARNKPPVFAV